MSATNSVLDRLVPSFPFPTEEDDHCESPLEAYEDITPFLNKLCRDDKSSLRIYDPYYCDGAVVRNLALLGFSNVENQNEDCYKVWSEKQFDVLVTNPPYSDDHIEKLVVFASQSNRPWFLLLPQWVHKKDYYTAATTNLHPFYLVPRKRYVYLPPRDFRESRKSDVHKKSSPFVSMWYCWGGAVKNEELIREFHRSNNGTCELARSKSAVRDLRRKMR